MSDSRNVTVAGAPLSCHHCGRDGFRVEKTVLDKSGLGFLVMGGMLWGHHPTMYVCSHCGFVHWFLSTDEVRHEVKEPAARASAER